MNVLQVGVANGVSPDRDPGARAARGVRTEGRPAARGSHVELDLAGVRWVQSNEIRVPRVQRVDVAAASIRAPRMLVWAVPVADTAHLIRGLRRIELHAVATGASAVAPHPVFIGHFFLHGVEMQSSCAARQNEECRGAGEFHVNEATG